MRMGRLLAAGALLYIVLSQVQGSAIAAEATALNPWPTFAALLALLGSVALMGLRWFVLLRLFGMPLRVFSAIRLTFIGDFVSQVIPGTVGGDAFRATALIRRYPRRKVLAATGVLVDRAAGMSGCVFLALVSLLAIFGGSSLQTEGLRASLVSLLAVAALATGAAIAVSIAARLTWVPMLPRRARRGAMHLLRELRFAVTTLRRAPARELLGVALLAAASQTLTVVAACFLGMALGLTAPVWVYFVNIPLIVIVSAVPITPGSIGVTEQLYIVYFSAYGNAEQGLLLGLAVRAGMLFSVLPGALFLAAGVRHR